jgi:hypothetical protein
MQFFFWLTSELITDGSYDISSAKPKASSKTSAPSNSAKNLAGRSSPATSTTSNSTPSSSVPPVPSVDLAEGEFQAAEGDGKVQVLLRLAKDDIVSSIQLFDGKVVVKCDQRDSYAIEVPLPNDKKLKLGSCKKFEALLCIDIIVIP